MRGCTVVLDIGKTLAKLTLLSHDRCVMDRKTRPNGPVTSPNGYPSLDVAGLESWLAESLTDFSKQGKISAIIPVTHGASACIVKDQKPSLAPLDYEAELPPDLRARYQKIRSPFHLTGSPSLPAGLNLGSQLYWLDATAPQSARMGQIVTWPQYWAYRLSGVAATEMTSMGCHTDLWQPMEATPSQLAVSQGWTKRFAPLRKASDVLGTVTKEWQDRCNIPANCAVYCGIHDSNAALLAVRGYAEIGALEHTLLSTGTWFIAMRTAGKDVKLDLAALPESRDCLVNVDAYGSPIPSARFMGGRELQILEAAPEMQIDATAASRALYAAAAHIVDSECFAVPTFQPGVGPFPNLRGRWIDRPNYQLGRRAAASLYLALMTDTSLDLIGSKERLVIEGRFAEDAIFCRALASLRPKQRIYVMPAFNSVAYGAMRLADPKLPPETALTAVEPLPFNISQYAARWYQLTLKAEIAA